MRRITAIEKGAAIFGLVLLVGGTILILRPSSLVLFHPGPGKYEAVIPYQGQEQVSEQKAQIYGGLAIVIGLGFGTLAFYRSNGDG